MERHGITGLPAANSSDHMYLKIRLVVFASTLWLRDGYYMSCNV